MERPLCAYGHHAGIKILAILTCGCLATALGACQRPMPLDEARRVTTSFAARPLTVPPRSADDVIAALTEGKLEESYERAQAVQLMRATPRPEADAAELAAFYRTRGMTASGLARPREAIPAFAEAVRYAEMSGGVDYTLRFSLAIAYSQGGSNGRALALLNEAIASVPKTNQGLLFHLYLRQAAWYAYAGDVLNAERAVRQLHALELESTRWTAASIRPEHRAEWAAMVHLSRAELARARGRLRPAEQALRAALAEIDAYPSLRSSYGGTSGLYNFIVAALGRVLAEQGRFLEAETEARRAVLSGVRFDGK